MLQSIHVLNRLFKDITQYLDELLTVLFISIIQNDFLQLSHAQVQPIQQHPYVFGYIPGLAWNFVVSCSTLGEIFIHSGLRSSVVS